jgi:hypothetical protein
MINKLELIKDNIEGYDNLMIDVGAASIAPHAATWLLNDPTCKVLIIEPNSINVENLINGNINTPEYQYVSSVGVPSMRMKDSTILINNQEKYKYSKNQAFLIDAAIDNVDTPQKTKFYCSDERNRGCSSLLAPGKEFGLEITRIDEVDVVSLEFILDYIGFPIDKLIKFVKTDVQGKDFHVVKSLGKYLRNVIALKCEYNVGNQYENSCSAEEFLIFMVNEGFKLIGRSEHDFFFINEKHETEDNLSMFNNLPQI